MNWTTIIILYLLAGALTLTLQVTRGKLDGKPVILFWFTALLWPLLLGAFVVGIVWGLWLFVIWPVLRWFIKGLVWLVLGGNE